MEKALHEAKVNVSWMNQNPEYVAGDARIHRQAFCRRPIAASPTCSGTRCRSFMPPVIYFGAINSLTQTLLKLTCPGVPDIYQGQELWDFSLVDPDNRRPVDFELRAHARWTQLCSTCGISRSDAGFARSCCATTATDASSFGVTMRALNFRREHPQLFQSGKLRSTAGVQGERNTWWRSPVARRGNRDCGGSALELHADEGQGRASAWRQSGATRNWRCRQRRLEGDCATSLPEKR